MTTNTETLTYDCPAKNMPFGRCCKLEPLAALRAAFESTVSEWGWDTYRNKAGDYATTSTNGAWAGYQAGHAAAKAETAAAVAAERDYWRNELHALLEAADAVATNNAHAVSIGSVRYAKHSQTWKAYASLDRARQRASDAIRAGAKEPSDAA